MGNMEQPNPYAAPQEFHMPEAGQPPGSPLEGGATSEGLWCQGNLLVMNKYAPLPDRCVKSNEPASGRLKRNLSWHHPAVYAAILAHLFIYIILALVMRKTATIYIGLSDEWFARRRRTILISWISVLLSFVLIGVGFANVDTGNNLVWLILVGFVLFFGGLIYGLIAARMVSAKRIDDTYVWLKGVHPDFLAKLPPWPYPHL